MQKKNVAASVTKWPALDSWMIRLIDSKIYQGVNWETEVFDCIYQLRDKQPIFRRKKDLHDGSSIISWKDNLLNFVGKCF